MMNHHELMAAIKSAYATSTHPDKEDLLLMALADYGDFKRMRHGLEYLFESSALTLSFVFRSLTDGKG